MTSPNAEPGGGGVFGGVRRRHRGRPHSAGRGDLQQHGGPQRHPVQNALRPRRVQGREDHSHLGEDQGRVPHSHVGILSTELLVIHRNENLSVPVCKALVCSTLFGLD